jgi:hypothetical protein
MRNHKLLVPCYTGKIKVSTRMISKWLVPHTIYFIHQFPMPLFHDSLRFSQKIWSSELWNHSSNIILILKFDLFIGPVCLFLSDFRIAIIYQVSQVLKHLLSLKCNKQPFRPSPLNITLV